MIIDNEFSELSKDYTIQEFEFKKGNDYPFANGMLRIPFFKTPKCASFRNNQAALKDKDFFKEPISELLKCGSIIEAEKPPEVIKPLSVFINS